MRSVMQGMWSLIVAVGNVIVIIVAEVKGIERQVSFSFLLKAAPVFMLHFRLTFPSK